MKLVGIDEIRPSTYNPRVADERRLEVVRLSIEKLGFILPICADADGEIISGHQRHLVARRMGFERVPVMVCKTKDEADRKALNIVFNRATNDMALMDHSDGITERLFGSKIDNMADALGDPADPFRCLQAAPTDVEPLAKRVRPQYDPHMRNTARALWSRFRIMLPVVVSESGRVVNGVGRIQYASERGRDQLPAVTIADAEADFAFAVLNLLSMDFDIHRRYADLLRYNSFRRAWLSRKELGTGFTRMVGDDFDISDPADASAWRLAYGRSVVDFGAGHMRETTLLRAAGVHVAAFEPYRMGERDQIDKAASAALTRQFLADVASGRGYDSVFVSSVLNSVPFRKDREHIITICAALCGPASVFHCNALHTGHENWKTSGEGGPYYSKRRLEGTAFALSYEPGITLGYYMERPKVQKYHTAQELYDLLKGSFGRVSLTKDRFNHYARAVRIEPVDAGRLRDALAFEFDLPYPDGTRMGLVDEAVAAFEARGTL